MLVLCIFLSITEAPHSTHKLFPLQPAAAQGFPRPCFFPSPRGLVKLRFPQLNVQEKFPDCCDRGQGFSLVSFLSLTPSGRFIPFAQPRVS